MWANSLWASIYDTQNRMKEKTGYTFYSVFVFMGKECQKPQEKQIGRLPPFEPTKLILWKSQT